MEQFARRDPRGVRDLVTPTSALFFTIFEGQKLRQWVQSFTFWMLLGASWELTYLLKRQCWRWFSFSKGGIWTRSLLWNANLRRLDAFGLCSVDRRLLLGAAVATGLIECLGIEKNDLVRVLHSLKLTYTLPRHFWRWFSFSQGGTC